VSGLGNFVYKHRKLTALVWILLLVGITTWSQKAGTAYSDSFTLPNTESTTALNLLMKYQKQESGASIQVVSPFAAAARSISADGTIAFATVYLNGTGRDIPDAAIKTIIKDAQSFQSPKLEVELLGQVVQQANQTKPGSSEGIALLMAAIILLITFGSVVATLIPLFVAVIGLGILSSGV